MYEEDFVDETPVEFELSGRKFKYKILNAEESNDMLKDLFYIDDKGTMQKDLSVVNKYRATNLVSVPWKSEVEWSKMTKLEKWKLIGKIDRSLFTKIIGKIDKIEKKGSDALKKS